MVFLSNPGGAGEGFEANFFTWAKTLYALACGGDVLVISAGVEPRVLLSQLCVA